MDILVPDQWLREFIKTNATPLQIREYVSLIGPSVERIEGSGESAVYSVEVTTNRVDTASIFGFAREVHATMPRFDKKSELVSPVLKNTKFKKAVDYIDIKTDKAVTPRFCAVLIEGLTARQSSPLIQKRLKAVGIRPINQIVDITNYVMTELGQPLHAFDYKSLKNKKISIREAKKGEHIKTLDSVKHTLLGGEIVIENDGHLIDLAGIMGGENSKIDESTTAILLCAPIYAPEKIRKASMSLSARSVASGLFEKGLDTEGAADALKRAIYLYEELGGVAHDALDIYLGKPPITTIKVTDTFINDRLGVSLKISEMEEFLRDLQFNVSVKGNTLQVTPPSFRALDVTIPEDIVEEIARMYGYHNIPSTMLSGALPEQPVVSEFAFIHKLKTLMKGYGGVEVYTQSLVSSQAVGDNALRIKNPLGAESEYLRTSLSASLLLAAAENKHTSEPYHLFEISRVYLPQGNGLPNEQLRIAGVFGNSEYRAAKGILTAFFHELHIKREPKLQVVNGIYVYEYELEDLAKNTKPFNTFEVASKYPSQIEDITIKQTADKKIGEIISALEDIDVRIVHVDYIDSYQENLTFRVRYHDPKKTLTNPEVAAIRGKIEKSFEVI